MQSARAPIRDSGEDVMRHILPPRSFAVLQMFNIETVSPDPEKATSVSAGLIGGVMVSPTTYASMPRCIYTDRTEPQPAYKPTAA